MPHAIHQVTGFELLGGFRLRIEFEDQTEQTIDLEPVLSGEIYGPLRSPSIFQQVRLDPEVRTLVWPNGADFDPATLHDWPQHEEAFRRLADSWEKVRV